MSWVRKISPKSMEGQVVMLLSLSLLVLLVLLTAFEVQDRRSAIQWADTTHTLNRLKRMQVALQSMHRENFAQFLQVTSLCHEGYTVTPSAFAPLTKTNDTQRLSQRLQTKLSLSTQQLQVGKAILDRNDFDYSRCSDDEIDLPLNAIVISIKLESGDWFNTEVHPHEWHFQDLFSWIVRYGAAFGLVGLVSVLFLRRLNLPFRQLTHAAERFARGLTMSPVPESGPPDLQRAIHAFNAMQKQVSEDVRVRMQTLAAISHDIRTPLTALRIKAELVKDPSTRKELIRSVEKMESITAAGLSFLREGVGASPKQTLNLSELVASECADFCKSGEPVEFLGEANVMVYARADALARAVRNLIENAVKYGALARVRVEEDSDTVSISVSDEGPGIPEDRRVKVLEPFSRLSNARESSQGGFGLGLALVKLVVDNHGGTLSFESASPQGLCVILRLPKASKTS